MDTNRDEGWIKLYRKSIYSRVFQTEGLWKVWTWCLLKANHEEAWVPVKTGRGETVIHINRGQFLFGRNSASKELRMKPKTVEYRIKLLANMQNLAIQTYRHYSVITILNYNTYQNQDDIDKKETLPTNCQPTATNKNDKNINKYIGRSKNPTDPRVKEFFSYWGQAFTQHTGQPYTFSYGKEGRLAKALLQTHPLSFLQEMIEQFFRDDQCKRRGLTIGVFFSEINRIIGLRAMSPLEQVKREILG